MGQKINVLDLFEIVANDDRKQFEFTPRVDGHTSYTVSYNESDNVEDACIAVWNSIKRQHERGILNPQP